MNRNMWFLSSLLLLASCANGASFTQDAANGANAADNVNLPAVDPGTPSTPAEVAATCETAEANGTLQELTQPLYFGDPGQTCDWNKNGNLGPRDLYHQARTEQKLSVSLPLGSTLCHVKTDFAKQKFRFDDHFWLTLNDVILASSINYSDRFRATNGLTTFDWSKIVGTHWDTSREGTWCLKGASCSWPQTDTEGTIQMSFPEGSYYAITARDRARTQHTFSFVTVGDNDASDCQHRPVNMSVTLQYVR